MVGRCGTATAKDVRATGMLSAIVAPLAATGVPVEWFRVSAAVSSWSRPIGWMRPVRYRRRPATKSGANRECRALEA